MTGLRRAATALTMALSALVLLAAMAVPGRAANREDLEAFLQVTGFDVALESIKLSAAGGPQMLGLEGSDFATTWTILTKDVFDVKTMQDMGLDILEKTITEEDLEVAQDFYGSELGKRLVETENTSHLAERADRAENAAAELDRILNEGETDRIAVLDRLNRAVDSSDSSERSIVEIQFRFLTAARDAGVIEFKVDDEALRQSLLTQAEAMRDANKAQALANSAYTYRDFTTQELTTYAEALEQPGMQRVYELMNAVQYEIMANRFEEVASRLHGIQPSQDL
ncbi:DUF2059 domain-containing protein [Pseudooceanicola sediminis]|uniref:DUF2059 domain-containing protein n=2 Tax=Pseudooceanicola sediminis TaxID=2211117 RepID=A0A399J5W5_9RHOB|nr:DUF2059 domain-containing protein [Puniceibacterium sp. HSS470]RII40805.1 DUF2059 domain-containing protein [Pseudooceanicola sediminis]